MLKYSKSIMFINIKQHLITMAKEPNQIKACPECGSDNVFYKESTNQMICKDCGLIYEVTTQKKR